MTSNSVSLTLHDGDDGGASIRIESRTTSNVRRNTVAPATLPTLLKHLLFTRLCPDTTCGDEQNKTLILAEVTV